MCLKFTFTNEFTVLLSYLCLIGTGDPPLPTPPYIHSHSQIPEQFLAALLDTLNLNSMHDEH